MLPGHAMSGDIRHHRYHMNERDVLDGNILGCSGCSQTWVDVDWTWMSVDARM